MRYWDGHCRKLGGWFSPRVGPASSYPPFLLPGHFRWVMVSQLLFVTLCYGELHESVPSSEGMAGCVLLENGKRLENSLLVVARHRERQVRERFGLYFAFFILFFFLLLLLLFVSFTVHTRVARGEKWRRLGVDSCIS